LTVVEANTTTAAVTTALAAMSLYPSATSSRLQWPAVVAAEAVVWAVAAAKEVQRTVPLLVDVEWAVAVSETTAAVGMAAS